MFLPKTVRLFNQPSQRRKELQQPTSPGSDVVLRTKGLLGQQIFKINPPINVLKMIIISKGLLDSLKSFGRSWTTMGLAPKGNQCKNNLRNKLYIKQKKNRQLEQKINTMKILSRRF